MKSFTYRHAIACYTFFFFVLFFPYWGGGEVIAPFRQFAELGLPDTSLTNHIENRKFSDFPQGYIPAISEHFHAPRSGWMTLWTENNELGRPVYHRAGFSPAWLPSWVLAHCTSNPWRFITTLSLSICFLSGVFFMLFSRSGLCQPDVLDEQYRSNAIGKQTYASKS